LRLCSFGGYGLAVTDWRLRRWRLWFSALSNAPQENAKKISSSLLKLVFDLFNHAQLRHLQGNFSFLAGCMNKRFLIFSSINVDGLLEQFLSRWPLERAQEMTKKSQKRHLDTIS